MPTHCQPARILVVDDDSATLSLLTAYLVSDGHDVVTAGNEPDAVNLLEREGSNLVLLDLLQPRLDRSEVCRRLKGAARCASTPVIVSADAATLVDRSRLQDAGVDDFVSKPYQRTELLLRVGAMLRNGSLSGKLQEKTVELRSAKALLRKQAITDALTGLNNKSHFEVLLDRELGKAERRSGSLSMVVLSVNGLRQVNRGHGHGEGDRLLRQIAGAFRHHDPNGSLAARYGDKRFVLLLPGAGADDAREIARDLTRQVRERQEHPGVGFSVSVTAFPDDASDRRGMLQAIERRRIRRGETAAEPWSSTGRPRAG